MGRSMAFNGVFDGELDWALDEALDSSALDRALDGACAHGLGGLDRALVETWGHGMGRVDVAMDGALAGVSCGAFDRALDIAAQWGRGVDRWMLREMGCRWGFGWGVGALDRA